MGRSGRRRRLPRGEGITTRYPRGNPHGTPPVPPLGVRPGGVRSVGSDPEGRSRITRQSAPVVEDIETHALSAVLGGLSRQPNGQTWRRRARPERRAKNSASRAPEAGTVMAVATSDMMKGRGGCSQGRSVRTRSGRRPLPTPNSGKIASALNHFPVRVVSLRGAPGDGSPARPTA